MSKSNRKVLLDFNDLLPIGITLAVLGIALSYGADVVADVQNTLQTCANAAGPQGEALVYNTSTQSCHNVSTPGTNHGSTTAQFNTSQGSLESLDDIGDNTTTIVGVLVAAVIIGILLRNFFLRG